MSKQRYAVGIDLGTTHCALSYVDSEHSDGEQIVQELMPIAQLTGAGSVEKRPVLPSFQYLPHPDEFSENDLSLPWESDTSRIAGE